MACILSGFASVFHGATKHVCCVYTNILFSFCQYLALANIKNRICYKQCGENGQIARQVNELRGVYAFLSQYGWDAIGDAYLDIGFQNGVLTPIDEVLRQKVMERACKY